MHAIYSLQKMSMRHRSRLCIESVSRLCFAEYTCRSSPKGLTHFATLTSIFVACAWFSVGASAQDAPLKAGASRSPYLSGNREPVFSNPLQSAGGQSILAEKAQAIPQTPVATTRPLKDAKMQNSEDLKKWSEKLPKDKQIIFNKAVAELRAACPQCDVLGPGGTPQPSCANN